VVRRTPKADKVARLTETELIDMGLASLAEIFNVSPNGITRHLVASRAINWGNDPFAPGAYSYATPKHEKRSQRWETKWWCRILFWRGALCRFGSDMRTVEAALAA
jgi:monoamine oxidase